jgi:hypothetical protein
MLGPPEEGIGAGWNGIQKLIGLNKCRWLRWHRCIPWRHSTAHILPPHSVGWIAIPAFALDNADDDKVSNSQQDEDENAHGKVPLCMGSDIWIA